MPEAEGFGSDAGVEFGALVGFGVGVLDEGTHVDVTPGLMLGAGEAGVEGEGVAEQGEDEAHQVLRWSSGSMVTVMTSVLT